MHNLLDWKTIFVPDVSVLEIVLRGSLMYLSIFVLLRIMLKRQTGTLGTTDLLLITLLADASQNAMAGEYKSVPDGIVLVGTIIFWNYAFDWLSFKFPWFERLIEPAPLPLVKNGRLLRRNMRKELVTETELLGQLREQGVDDISKVKDARIESDGQISVVEYDNKKHKKAQRKNR
ncbi:MAG TPA: YetF domain-containing protein [Pyrinomonadaceae bacterium]|nr:YetF domain-containing protein [Pyrinomonadaceae bacterium]